MSKAIAYYKWKDNILRHHKLFDLNHVNDQCRVPLNNLLQEKKKTQRKHSKFAYLNKRIHK